MGFGIEVINWYTLTDPNWFKGFADPFSIIYVIGNGLMQGFVFFRMIDTCIAQFEYSANGWLSQMYTELTPVTPYGYDALYDTMYLVAILWNGFMVWWSAGSGNKYYYQLGHNGTQMLTRLFLWGDKIAQNKSITVSKPWLRYFIA